MRYLVSISVGFVLSLLLLRCGSESSVVALNGLALAGPIADGAVSCHCYRDDGTEDTAFATGVTDKTGTYTATAAAPCNPFVVKVTGGTYTEESGGAVVNVGTRSFRAIVVSSGGSVEVSLSPLTEIAATYLSRYTANWGSLTAAAKAALADASNRVVARAIGLPEDKTLYSIRPADPTKACTDAKSSECLISAIVGGISHAATDSKSNSVDITKTMAEELADKGNLKSSWSKLGTQVAAFNATFGAAAPTINTAPTPPTIETGLTAPELSGLFATVTECASIGAGVFSRTARKIAAGKFFDGTARYNGSDCVTGVSQGAGSEAAPFDNFFFSVRSDLSVLAVLPGPPGFVLVRYRFANRISVASGNPYTPTELESLYLVATDGTKFCSLKGASSSSTPSTGGGSTPGGRVDDPSTAQTCWTKVN